MLKLKIDNKKKHIINICVFSFVALCVGFMAGSGIVASVSNDIFDNYDLTPKAEIDEFHQYLNYCIDNGLIGETYIGTELPFEAYYQGGNR